MFLGHTFKFFLKAIDIFLGVLFSLDYTSLIYSVIKSASSCVTILRHSCSDWVDQSLLWWIFF